MNEDREAEKMMIKARIHMLRFEPFFGSLALRLPLVERHDLKFKTLATDGQSLFYDPGWVRSNPHEIRKSGVAHEVGHCILQHMARLGSRAAGKWNEAGDYVINAMLKESGFTVPSTWLYDPKFDGMTTEQVYRLLPDSTGDKSFDLLLPAPGAGGKATEAEEQVVAQSWAVAVVQAANGARKAGKLPASIDRFVKALLSSKADWATLLKRFITEQTREGYSWRKYNKRFAAMDIFLPGRYSEVMETLVVVADDSGSINSKVLAAFAAETNAARDAATPMRTILISCDARVNHTAVFEPGEPLVIKNKGGGGTDFRPPFEWLAREGITPSCLVYLTDLEGRFPSHAPDYPVLWCSINNKVAPWGETVKVEV